MGPGLTRIAGAAVTLGAAWALAPGCGGSTRSDGSAETPGCPAGTEGCPCRDGEECDDSLTCAAGTCVEVTEQPAPVDEPPCPNLPQEMWETACVRQSVEWLHLNDDLLLVVDASASLGEPVPGLDATRWDLLRNALGQVTLEARDTHDVGLLLVPAAGALPTTCDGAPDACCQPGGSAELTVPVAPGAEALGTIGRVLEQRAPSGASPLAAALAQVYEHLENRDWDGSRVVLLATDGGANCNPALGCASADCTLDLDPSESCSDAASTCCQAGAGGCLDVANVAAEIQRLRDAFVITIVAGAAGNEQYAAALDQWAAVEPLRRPGSERGYFEVSSEADVRELVEVFQLVSTHLATDCEVPLDEPLPDRHEVEVAVDCELIPYDQTAESSAESWWFYNNSDPSLATTIILGGAACEAMQTLSVDRVDVVVSCLGPGP